MPFTIALVGRANTGKSTLFNRLTADKAKATPAGKAITADQPGVTRDWREGGGRLADLRFQVIDTAGMDMDRAWQNKAAAESIQAMTDGMLRHCQLCLLLCDGKVGITAGDRSIAQHLRKLGLAVRVVFNKCEGGVDVAELLGEGWQFGFGSPIAISAAHGEGMADLYDAISEGMLAADMEDDGMPDSAADAPIRVAIIGRPNTGKSTLINRLVGETRLLTGEEAGITRDSIDIRFQHNDQHFILTDTAGVRRRGRIQNPLEKSMVEATRNAIRFAHVVILCVDAPSAIGRQDLALARLVADEGRAPVIAITMWDIVADAKKEKLLATIAQRLDKSMGQLRGVTLVAVSAISGDGLDGLLTSITGVYQRWGMRLATPRLNQWLADKLEAHPPPIVAGQGRRVRIRYMTQIKTRPPSFALFVNRSRGLPAHYVRYLASGLRQDFGLAGVPLRLLMRSNKNPYVR